MAAAVTPELSPLLRWDRWPSSPVVVATGELTGSLVLSVLGLLWPLLAGAFVVFVLVVLARRLVALLRERRGRATPGGGAR